MGNMLKMQKRQMDCQYVRIIHLWMLRIVNIELKVYIFQKTRIEKVLK